MNGKNQKILIWTGAILSLIYTAGYGVLMGLFPPPSPALAAAQVTELYANSNMQFRLGVMLSLASGGFYLPWVIVISLQMARCEKGVPLWAISQGLAGTLQTGLFFAAPIFWAAAAFSPERDPAITLLMHELAFLTFVATICVFPLQLIPIAIVCFSNKDNERASAFPRWLGYITLFLAVSGESGLAAVVFKSGPFAWNGLLAFYIPLVIFGIWLGGLIFTLLRAIGIQERTI